MKLESKKKAELIDIILRKDEVEKELRKNMERALKDDEDTIQSLNSDIYSLRSNLSTEHDQSAVWYDKYSKTKYTLNVYKRLFTLSVITIIGLIIAMLVI